jgi:eukaryotic-like serine/threonine-protein kinase
MSPRAMPCLDENVVTAYAQNRLAMGVATEVDEHLASCNDCRRLVFALAGSAPHSHGAATIGTGDRLGRYVVGEPRGAGAMGMVFEGHDPELGRSVALKVLKGTPTPEGQARLLREARALAQLSHPNIVSVFDVGRSGEEVFLAMELLDGRDLADWLRESERSWREVVALFIEAGKGLAAAHAIGIIHRDLKPTNLFVESSGRVRVTDFGLARLDRAEAERGDGLVSDTNASLTHGLVGTPAYMAPEQHAGGASSALSDQFSFCVSLYEALYGERPFRGDTLEALRDHVRAGTIVVPEGNRVPAWLRRIVLRGLAVDPEARYSSLDELVTELSRDPSVRRRRVLLASTGLALLGGLAFVGTRDRAAEDLRCTGAERKLVGVWDANKKLSVQSAFLGVATPYGADAWRTTERALDRYTKAWVGKSVDVCKATHVRGEQSAELLDLRMQCLDGQLAGVKAMVDVLGHPDRDSLPKAVQLAETLPNTAWCDDVDTLKAVAAPTDPLKRGRVTEFRRELARAEVLREGGNPKQALELAKRLVANAPALQFAPVEAEAMISLGRAQSAMADPQTAAATLRAGIMRADAARLDALRASALTDLAVTTGSALAKADDAREISHEASAVVERLPDRDDLEGQVANANGVIELKAGKYDEARAHFERALGFYDKVLGPQSMKAAIVLRNLAIIEVSRNNNEEAEKLVTRSLAMMNATIGPNHPAVAKNLSLLGDTHWRTGRIDSAIDYSRRAVEIAERALGPEHGDLGWLLNNLGGVLAEKGDLDEALKYQQRAVTVFEKAFGRENPETAMALNGLGGIAFKKGDLEAALAAGKAALAIREKTLGPDHPRVAYDLALVSGALIGLDRSAEAIEPLERALAMRIKRDGESEEVAEGRFELAEAMWNANRDRPRALRLARQAREYIRTMGHPPANDNIITDMDTFFRGIGQK